MWFIKSGNTVIKYRYELIAAVIGAVIMMLELVGARMIAPYFGTSLYVWTSVIGVILGALSVGYIFGGRWADRFVSDTRLALIIFLSALLLLTTQVFYGTVLNLIATAPLDLRAQAFLAAILLFAPVNFFFGLVTPYLAKLRLTSLSTVGRSIGRLDASATLGSISGTFLAGYWLLSYVGSQQLGFALVGVLVLISIFAAARPLLKARLGLLAVALLFGFAGGVQFIVPGLLYDGDSAYSRYQVIDVRQDFGTIRQLRTDNLGIQSAILVEDPTAIVANYNAQFFEIAKARTTLERVLVIGGGTFTLPTALAARFPEVRIDVVEIDPKLEEIAKDFFFYKDNPRVSIYNEDGRTYLNTTDKKYDLIVMDAFSSLSPPFQLTTQEAVARIDAALTSDGQVAVNLISAYEGDAAEFLRATVATYATRFSNIDLYQSNAGRDLESRQNIILVAGNAGLKSEVVTGEKLPIMPPDASKVLTDNYAPVERLTRFR